MRTFNLNKISGTLLVLIVTIGLLHLLDITKLNIQHITLFILVFFATCFKLLRKNNSFVISNYEKLIAGIIFYVIFSFADKVNLLQRFNISSSYNISIATILLSIGFLLYLIKTYLRREIVWPSKSPYFKTILFSIVACSLFMIMLWVLFHAAYTPDLSSLYTFLQKGLKLIFCILLMDDLISSPKYSKITIHLFCLLSLFTVALYTFS